MFQVNGETSHTANTTGPINRDDDDDDDDDDDEDDNEDDYQNDTTFFQMNVKI